MPNKPATLSSKVKPNATKKVVPPIQTDSAQADPVAYYKAMGSLIGFHRRMAKLTQAELAEKIHLTRSSITNIEGGIQVPQPIALTSMARVLDVQEQAFFPKPGSSQEKFQETLAKLDPAHRDVIEQFVGRV